MSEVEYKKALERIEELLLLVNEETPINDPNVIELNRVSDIVEAYETDHYPIITPSLREVIKLRMYEMSQRNEYLINIRELNKKLRKNPLRFLNGFFIKKLRKLR